MVGLFADTTTPSNQLFHETFRGYIHEPLLSLNHWVTHIMYNTFFLLRHLIITIIFMIVIDSKLEDQMHPVCHRTHISWINKKRGPYKSPFLDEFLVQYVMSCLLNRLLQTTWHSKTTWNSTWGCLLFLRELCIVNGNLGGNNLPICEIDHGHESSCTPNYSRAFPVIEE